MNLLSIISFETKETPARLGKKQTFKEKYEVELILLKGLCVILILFLIAYLVGPSNPSIEGVI